MCRRTPWLATALLLSCGPGVGNDTGPASSHSTTDSAPTTTDPADTGQPTHATTSTPSSTTSTTADPSAETGSLTDGRDSNGSLGFIDRPDGGICHCTECSVWEQDCLEDERCMPWANDGMQSWNATRCAPQAPDPASPGEPCTTTTSPTSGLDDCDGLSMCWNVDPETLEGTCVPLCTDYVDPMCPAGLGCVAGNDGVIIVCLPHCDPFASTCAANEVCAPAGSDNSPSNFHCLPTQGGTLHPWRTCADGSPCPEGTACRPADELANCDTETCCTPLCNLDAPDPDTPCPPNHTCTPFFAPNPTPQNLPHVGICHLP